MVEQVDRDAAVELQKVRYKGGHAALSILAAHRIAAEQRGREQERTAVVDWLEASGDEEDAILARQIKAGQHLGGEHE